MERFAEPQTYAAWSKDIENRYYSTSGGVFTEIAKAIISQGGVVAGAQYNNENMVEHVIVDSLEDLWKLRQSKYISSNPGNIYKQVKSALDSNIVVGFCGSPCQIAGLYAFLGTEPKNLITIDFICRGMNSPKALKSWLNEIEKAEGNKIVRVWFKYKEGGWKTSPRRVRLDFDDGHYIVKEGTESLFMHGYLTSNLYIRPCCGQCRFKGIPRMSDITLADFWGIEKELDDDKGTSLILINSNRGNNMFELIKDNMEWFEKDFSSIFAGNPMFSSSVIVSKKSTAFLKELDTLSFSKAIKKYSVNNKSFYSRLKRKIKKVLTVKNR